MSHAKIKVFISHSHRDLKVGNGIKQLLLAAFQELNAKEIRLTSRPDTGLRVGEVVNKTLIDDIRQALVFIGVLSNNYLSSIYCVAEYGAKIGSGEDPHIFYIPGMDPKELPGVFRDRHSVVLTDKHAVTAFLEDVGDRTDWKFTPSTCDDELKALCSMNIEAGDNLTELRSRLIPDIPPPFLNAYGLEMGIRREPLYQNFDCDKEDRNTEPVQFFWADSRRSNWIRANLIISPLENFLRIEFEHRGGEGCDISIRPQNETALLNDYSHLVIDARVSGNGDQSLPVIGMSLRLVNGYMQHWRLHRTRENPQIYAIESREFGKAVRIPLNKSEWVLFGADGTVDRGPTKKNNKPDLRIITSINLSLGGYKKFQHSPLPGRGRLDIREIRFE